LIEGVAASYLMSAHQMTMRCVVPTG
jgi:hypothetical protein